MKDEEIQRLILDFKIDNIKQERELFKHIAILSSAIVGIFVFNGNFNLSIFTLIGICGLFLVIVLSVVLLFIILRIERQQAQKTNLFMVNIKNVRKKYITEATKTLFKKDNLALLVSLFNSFKLKNILNVIKILKLSYLEVKKGDKLIEEEKDKFKYNNQPIRWLGILSIFSIILFVISLLLILIDIILVSI